MPSPGAAVIAIGSAPRLNRAAEEKLSCIQRTACEDPKTASEYATAAKMVHKVHNMVGVYFGSKYETVLNALEDAKSHSLHGGDCTVYAW